MTAAKCRRAGSKIHAEQDTRLLAFEIDQIKRTDGGGARGPRPARSMRL